VKRSKRSHLGLALAGLVVIAAGFAIAIAEAMRMPKYSIWVVVGVTVAVVALIRVVTRRR
jgi:mannose/fructose/N-acetylgalactosamine-specific phosphotransferase system component IIC